MNKACFVLMVVIVAINPACLFAGETIIIHQQPAKTEVRTKKCDFRIDKCETSVATDPSYMRFKDYPPSHGSTDVGAATADPAFYRPAPFTFKDFQTPEVTVDELIAFIQEKLNKVNCPQIDFSFDEDTGDINIRYVHSACGCDWTVNVRDVKADDFVWKHSTDNYSDRLGQMERRKFHCVSGQDAQDIESAFTRICVINGWQPSKY